MLQTWLFMPSLKKLQMGKIPQLYALCSMTDFCHNSGLGHFRGWFSVICNQELILGSLFFLEWTACYLSLKFCMVCFPWRKIQSLVIPSICILLCNLHIWPFSSLSCAPHITFYGSGHLYWTTSRSRLFSALRTMRAYLLLPTPLLARRWLLSMPLLCPQITWQGIYWLDWEKDGGREEGRGRRGERQEMEGGRDGGKGEGGREEEGEEWWMSGGRNQWTK